MCAMLASCMSVKQVGKLNMISNRNVESKVEYELVKSYSGGSKKELKKSKAITIEDAIDNTVRAVPGGEFLKNVKVYLVNGKYFAVEGDVWGIANNITFKGFKIGDKVTWKNKKSPMDKLTNSGKKDYLTGRIASLKNDKTCFVKVDGEEQTVELLYDDITKVQ